MKIFSLLFGIVLLAVSSCTNNNNLCGHVSGCDSDTLLIYVADVSTGKWVDVDTIALRDGYFETHIVDTALLEVQVSAMRKHGSDESQIIGESFLFFPGDKMRLEGNLPYGINASGTNLYDALAEQKELVCVNTKLSEVDELSSNLDEDEDALLSDSLDMVYDRLIDEQNQLKFKVIQQQPNSLLAGYLALSLQSEEGVKAISLLSDEVKNGLLANLITEVTSMYERDLSIEQAKDKIMEGNVAPHLSFKGLEGKIKTSADFRGKYMVLDFWGSWCGWCLAGIPKMKTYYAKYNDKVEFVGVCTSDKEDKWRRAVDKYELPWVNLFAEEDTEVLLDFAISCFPTKIIVDPEGNIVDVFEGESEDFYEKLDLLFK